MQEKCLILEAIRTVEERCHAKESCTLQAAPDILARGLRDPCPGVRYSTVQWEGDSQMGGCSDTENESLNNWEMLLLSLTLLLLVSRDLR